MTVVTIARQLICWILRRGQQTPRTLPSPRGPYKGVGHMIRTLVIGAAAGAIVVVGLGLAPPATASPFPDCKTAKADGRCDVPSSDPMYGSWLDRDHDGIGCEC